VTETLVRYLLLHKRSNAIATHAWFNCDLSGCKYLARRRILARVLDTTVALTFAKGRVTHATIYFRGGKAI
jgi:hypothetical protein